jgi:hypothetical protein
MRVMWPRVTWLADWQSGAGTEIDRVARERSSPQDSAAVYAQTSGRVSGWHVVSRFSRTDWHSDAISACQLDEDIAACDDLVQADEFLSTV